MATMMRAWSDVGIDVPPGARGEIDTLCPQCSHARKKSRAKCLSVNIESGVWHCAHCFWSGSLGYGPNEPGYGAQLRPEPEPREYRRPEPLPDDPLSPKARAFFASRGIPEWVMAASGVRSVRRWVPQLEREAECVAFPYYRAGELVNVKYRGPEKSFFMERNAERVLYGLDDAAGQDIIVIVEGEMDKLAIDTAQAWPTVSVPDGAPPADARNYGAKFAFLESAQALFDEARTVVIATDMDAPGVKLAEELARRIGPWKCRRVTWPDGCKDANDALMAHGVDGVSTALANAQPWPVAGVTTVDDLFGEVVALYENGFDRGVEIGWPQMDQHYRVKLGSLNIVTGVPGHGKSAWLDNVLVRLAERHDWPIAICSPENQPLARHLAGLIAVKTGLPFTDGPTPRMSVTDRDIALRWARNRFAFVLPEAPTVEAIIDLAKTLLWRQGLRGLVIDPWNELDHSRPANLSETEYVSRCLTTLRNFARRHQIVIWLVAHPTKLRRDVDGSIPVPSLYDISGSANFANKADFGLSIWRDPTAPEVATQVWVQKVRFRETGRVGMVEFRYDPPTGRFHEVGGNAR